MRLPGGSRERFLGLGAYLSGAHASGAVGLEGDEGIEFLEERAIVFFLESDDGEQAVRQRFIGGERFRVFCGLPCGLHVAAGEFYSCQLIVCNPGPRK